ncbi:MAG: stage V sporulation protein AE, partial [Bacillota bacterium]|nr:stage V sporulation protein AE [Bacillota bacterium]
MSNAIRNVIVVTDGDKIAKNSVEVACRNLGLRCISMSAGNPSPISPLEASQLVLQAKGDPVVIMVDDKGIIGEGKGEHILKYLANNTEINIIGVLAVASNTPYTLGVEVNCSITKTGQIYSGVVNKEGIPEPQGHHLLEGDTVEVLNELEIPLIVGIGDI